MNNIIEKCKTTRILAIIGVIGLFLGVILPYGKYTFWALLAFNNIMELLGRKSYNGFNSCKCIIYF